MNLTDEVYLIKQYIDTSGNFWAKGKYLYGEMPVRIKDDINYVVPVNNAEVKITPLTGSLAITDELIINMPPKDEIKPSYSTEQVKVIPIVQPEAIKVVVPRKRKTNESPTTETV